MPTALNHPPHHQLQQHKEDNATSDFRPESFQGASTQGHDHVHDTALLELHSSLSGQATRLLHELTRFQEHLTAHVPRKDIFLARFSREVCRETDLLARYGQIVDQHRQRGSQHRQQHEDRDHCVEDDHRSNSRRRGGLEDPNEDKSAGTEEVKAHGEDRNESEVRDRDEDKPKDSSVPELHNIRSSNITSYVAVWEEAKRNEGLVALKKKVKYVIGGKRSRTRASFSASHGGLKVSYPDSERRHRDHDGNDQGQRRRDGRETVMVDIVAEHGRKWIKVWTKSHAWLEMDMAKEGLVDLLDEDEDEEGNENGSGLDGGYNGECSGKGKLDASHLTQRDREALQDLKLVKMASEFVAAAKTTRVDHQHPKVHFVLPKIYRGRSRDVDVVLAVIEQMGIAVSCFGEHNQFADHPRSTLTSLSDRMLKEPEPHPRPNNGVLNLDCTVLIALISDISHFELRSDAVPNGVEIPGHYHGQTRCDIVDQFRSDQQRPLLPSDVYPTLSGKRLLCTSVAANHLQKIVRLMGTETELKRAETLLGHLEVDEARIQWNRLSMHPSNHTIDLPIEVVDFDMDRALLEIRQQSQARTENIDFEIAQRLSNFESRHLSDLNKAVFAHGWSSRVTTFTLNRVVSGYIHRAIDELLDEVEAQRMGDENVNSIIFHGPRMEICARERSLIGSEKTCRNK